MKIKQFLISLLISTAIILGNSIPARSLDLRNNNSIKTADSDSTEIKKSAEQNANAFSVKNDQDKDISGSKVSYNIIYYLIAKFILINPFSRPN